MGLDSNMPLFTLSNEESLGGLKRFRDEESLNNSNRLRNELLLQPDSVTKWRKLYPDNHGIKLLQDYVNGKSNGLNARVSIYQTFCRNGDKFWMGLTMLYGFGCEKRPSNGTSLIRTAAIEGCTEALNFLGICYFISNKVSLALDLFKRASERGNPCATQNLDIMRSVFEIQCEGSQMPRPLCAV